MSSNNIPGKLRFSPSTVFGDTAANDTILEEGTLAIDVAKDVINIHDGVTKGGIKQVQTAPIGQPVLTYKSDSIESPLPIVGTYLGSPSNPFASTAARNAAAPFAAGSVVWVSGSPSSTAWQLKTSATGSNDADWVAFGAGDVGIYPKYGARGGGNTPIAGNITPGNANNSYMMEFNSKYQDVIGMRFVFVNFDNSSTLSVGPAKLIPIGDRRHAGTSGLVQYPLTFSGSTTGTVPAAISGAGGNQMNRNTAGILYSDWVAISPIPRTDGGLYPLFQIRAYFSSASAFALSTVSQSNYWNSLYGDEYASTVASGDTVTTLTNMVAADNSFRCIGYPEFIYRTNTTPLYGVGDSLMQGLYSTNGVEGMDIGAMKTLRDYGYRVTCTRMAQAGQYHTVSYKTGEALIASGATPGILLMQSWSPNDGATQAALDKGFAETVYLCQKAKAAGWNPIIINAIPFGTSTKTLLKAQNAAIAASGYPYVDVWSVVNDPNNDGNIIASLGHGDDTHLNSEGYLACGQKIADTLISYNLVR